MNKETKLRDLIKKTVYFDIAERQLELPEISSYTVQPSIIEYGISRINKRNQKKIRKAKKH